VKWRWEGRQVWFWVGVIFEEMVGVWVGLGHLGISYGLKRWKAAAGWL